MDTSVCVSFLLAADRVLSFHLFSIRLLNIPSSLSLLPTQKLASESLDLLSLPYFPWARFNWSMYPLHAPSDVLAGLTVGIMLVPQGDKEVTRKGGQTEEACVLPSLLLSIYLSSKLIRFLLPPSQAWPTPSCPLSPQSTASTPPPSPGTYF